MSFKEEGPILAGINIRPGVQECLRTLRQHYQLGIFTASDEDYANPVIDTIDPNREFFSIRLFRQHCIKVGTGVRIKDLRII